MTSPAPSSEATPRRERIAAFMKGTSDQEHFPDDFRMSRVKVPDATGKRYEIALLQGDLRFLVNSYDESRKLLREAAEELNVAANLAGDFEQLGEMKQFRAFIARITAHLEAGK